MVKYQIENAVKQVNRENQIVVTFKKVNYTWPWQPILVTGLQVFVKDCSDQSNEIDLHCEEVSMDGLSIWQYLLHQKLSLRRLQVTNWRIGIKTNHQSSTIDLECLLENKGNTAGFRLEQLIIKTGQIQYEEPGRSGNQNNYRLIAKAQIDFKGSDINITPDNPLTYHQVQTKVSDLEYYIDNDLDQIKIAQIDLDSSTKNLTIDSIVYRTIYTAEKVATITGLQSHWYDIVIPKVKYHGLNLDSLQFKKSLHFQYFEMDNPYISVYHDKRPDDRVIEFKQLPHHWIQSLQIAVCIDSTSTIDNLNIYYQEHVKEWDDPGKINFTDTQVLIAPFNSQKDDFVSLKTTGLFLNSSLESEILIPSNDSIYKIKGVLGALALTQLNPMLALVTNTHISDGESENLSFEFEHDHMNAWGSSSWQYRNLAIAINEQKGKSNFTRKVGGFLINNFVIQNENQPGKDFRPGVIEFERDTTRSVFNFWWKSIASGLESSVR
ncbi:MAG: hypothetical protein DHS20C17_21760 [Cyclobacteriaceae bacterium]|nr:MAG: hypothetical protein DHS20C17_21760 [Cyclobacteriaceae bacterium]